MQLPKVLSKPGFRQFVIRVGIFLLAFVVLSFAIGSVIVGGPLLYELGFFVYGGAGYILMALSIFFLIFAREKLFSLKTSPRGNWWLGIITLICVSTFVLVGTHVRANPMLATEQPLLWGSILHVLFLLTFASLGFAVFPLTFIQRFARDLRRELLICLAIAVGFYAAMRLVWLSWPLLSFGVSRLVYWLLLAVPGGAVLLPPQTIIVEDFAVYVGEACSGVFSIFLFTCLYLLIVALDWKELRPGRVVFLFFVNLAALYLVNVLRVYSIILVGAYISRDFAANLFHSYVGMIFFIAYFVLFLWIGYDWLKRKPARLPK